MSAKRRVCPQCKVPVHPSQTVCTNCRAVFPAERPGRGKCHCCGEPLAAPLIGPGALVPVSGGLYSLGGSVNHSCLRCGDPNPTASSGFSSIGISLVALEVIAWSIVVPAMLFGIKGPYRLRGGQALVASAIILTVLAIWASLARRFALLAVPLFALFAFWPLAAPEPLDNRLKFFIAALTFNLLAFPMMLKTRRKPFAVWW